MTNAVGDVREAGASKTARSQAGAWERGENLRRCREDTERTYRRFLRPEHWPILEEARTTGRVTRSSQNEQPVRELLESRALLLYRNDVEWYGLHPAVEEIEPPKPPSKADNPAED